MASPMRMHCIPATGGREIGEAKGIFRRKTRAWWESILFKSEGVACFSSVYRFLYRACLTYRKQSNKPIPEPSPQ